MHTCLVRIWCDILWPEIVLCLCRHSENCSMFCMCTRSGSPHSYCIVCARDESYSLTTVTVVKNLLTNCLCGFAATKVVYSYRQQSLTSAFCPTLSLADQRWSAMINYATRGAQLSTAHKLSSLGLQRANLVLISK